MIELVTSMFQSIDAGAWPALRQFFAPHCVYERPGFAKIVGLDALHRFYSEERQVAVGRHTRLHAYHDPFNGMVATGEFSGVLKNGEEVSAEFADLYRFQGSLIVHRKTYFYAPLI